MKTFNTILKVPKLSIAIVLLIFLYIIETFLMITYILIERPLAYLLDKTENLIKYLIKAI
jgi:hypothetical protein